MDNDPIIIEFKTVGVDEVGRDMAPLVASLDRLNDTIAQASRGFQRMNQAAAQGASGIRQVASAARAAKGPFQALEDAERRLQQAMMGGNATAIRDARVNLIRKRQAAQRADDLLNPKPVKAKDPFIDMLMTSRVFMGPTGPVISPLVNRMMGAGGMPMLNAMQKFLGSAWGSMGASGAAGASALPGAASGAAGAAGAGVLLGPVAIVAAALVGLAVATKAAQDRFAGFNRTMAVSGASFGEAARGSRLAGGLGLGNVDQIARSFSDAIAGGGYAGMVARRLGINPNNNLYTGDLNDVGKLTKALEAIVDPSRMSDRDARAFARATGLEDALSARYASADVRALLLRRSMEQDNPGARRAAADNQILLNLAMEEFNRLMSELGVKVLPQVSNMLTRIIGMYEWEAKTQSKIDTAMKPVHEWIERGLKSGAVSAPPPGLRNSDSGRAQKDLANATAENTRAINGLNQTLSNGVYGSGSGGRTLPIGAIYDAFMRNGQGRLIEFGAFSL